MPANKITKQFNKKRIIITCIIIFSFLLSLVLFHSRKTVLKIGGIVVLVYLVIFAIDFGIARYDESITVDTSPNIVVEEYLPFTKDSKIATLDHEASLKLENDLPIIDGAAALFPVYSGFVNATYPSTVQLYDGAFEYNNTVLGYDLLAQKEVKDNTYNFINEIFGQKVTNTALFKEINALLETHTYEEILSYLQDNEDYLSRVMSKDFQSEYAKIRYFSHIRAYVDIKSAKIAKYSSVTAYSCFIVWLLLVLYVLLCWRSIGE